MEQNNSNFDRIAEAIGYICEHFKKQPSLDDIARKVYLNPEHFRRMFTDWAGVEPNKFLQYVSTAHAKKLLREGQATLSETDVEAEVWESTRMRDLFINIEGMTPDEYKDGGKNLKINYSFESTLFGEVIIASTSRGICHLEFHCNQTAAFNALKFKYPKAEFVNRANSKHRDALAVISHDKIHPHEVKLHLKGSDFQLRVWEALVRIPCGQLASYGQIANYINHPRAFRAVGTAISNNPVAYLIPCHRVIQSSGALGQYQWGGKRKTAQIGWESANAYKVA